MLMYHGVLSLVRYARYKQAGNYESYIIRGLAAAAKLEVPHTFSFFLLTPFLLALQEHHTQPNMGSKVFYLKVKVSNHPTPFLYG